MTQTKQGTLKTMKHTIKAKCKHLTYELEDNRLLISDLVITAHDIFSILAEVSLYAATFSIHEQNNSVCIVIRFETHTKEN